MKRFPRSLLAALAVSLAAPLPPAAADPSPQLVAQVQHRLVRYGFDVDVSQYDTATVALLYGIMNSADDDFYQKRLRLRTALRNATTN